MNAMDRLILSLFLGGPILLFMSHFWRRDVSPILTIWACQAMTWTTGRSKQWLVNDFIVFFDVPCFLVLGEFLKTKPTIASPESHFLPFDISELTSQVFPAEVGSTTSGEKIDYCDL